MIVKGTKPTIVFLMPARDKEPICHEPRLGVIYIGDSNHAFSSLAGNGANVTLKDSYGLHIKVRTSTPISFPKTTNSPSAQPSPSPQPDSNDNLGRSDETLSRIGLRAETFRASRPTNQKRWEIPTIYQAIHYKASTNTEYGIWTG